MRVCRCRLYQGQFDAVVSWTYNLGEGALKSSAMLKKINAGQHEQVPSQMKRWNRAGGKVRKRLERRREAEAALYEMRWYGSAELPRYRLRLRVVLIGYLAFCLGCGSGNGVRLRRDLVMQRGPDMGELRAEKHDQR